ncbi:hypothetical protein ACHAXT_000463 [Thalassiosira profunda]
MADDEVPDVDYEGEEEEAEEPAVAPDALPGKSGGDSETESESDGDGAGPRPPPAPAAGATAAGGGGGKGGAGDSATESEGGEGEIGPDGGGKATPQKRGEEERKIRHDLPSGMDRALGAPREAPCPEEGRGGESSGRGKDGGRESRWGARKQPPEAREHPGAYVPPAKRRLLEEQRRAAAAAKAENGGEAGEIAAGNKPPVSGVTPVAGQRQTWEDLQRSINGTINRLSPATIKPLIHSLFSEANLVRGRGVLARGILRASQASPQFAPCYAALMAVVNTKLPECGELLLTRAILAFRRMYKRRDRNGVSSTLALLGHLFNQGMAHELLSLQILTVLLDGDPTEDSVDVAVGYMCVVGRQLSEVSPAGVRAVMERFRGLLHEGSVGRRAQYRIETLLKIKRGGFKDYPTIPDEKDLDLVEREDQITFELGLDDEGLSNEEALDMFRYDEEYDEKEEEWKKIRAEILGEDSDSESGSGSDSGSDGESESEEEKEEVPDQALPDASAKKTVVVEDLTETDLVHLRRTIYLTIMSSATFEECTHKLAKMDIPPGRENELINMIVECCSQERTFLRYYGLISGRFCLLHERWQDAFEEAFAAQYNTIHRLETNKLRNVAKLFGHLLHTDSISWSVLSCIHLNEDETTSSSRIFIKILIQEMAEAMGMVTLKQRFDTDNPDPDGPVGEDAAAATAVVPHGRKPSEGASTREWFKGMFPKDNARNTRYAINFFTSIGLGPLTDGMREFLKNAPKLILAQAQAAAAAKEAQKDDDESSVLSSSSSDTSSFDSSSSSSGSSSSGSRSSSSSYTSYSSDSRDRRRKGRGRGRKRSRRRSRSYSSSSGSDSSPDSRRGGTRNKSSKGKRGGNRSPKRDDDSRNNESRATPSTGSKRRSVSPSPAGRRGRDKGRGRRSRSYSSSRSRTRSPSRGSAGKGRGDDKGKKRARSSSYSSASSRSRSRSPGARKESSKKSRRD